MNDAHIANFIRNFSVPWRGRKTYRLYKALLKEEWNNFGFFVDGFFVEPLLFDSTRKYFY